MGSASSGLPYSALTAGALAFATVLSAGYALRLIYHVAWGAPRGEAVEEPREMAAAMLCLCVLLVALFFVPGALLEAIGEVVRGVS